VPEVWPFEEEAGFRDGTERKGVGPLGRDSALRDPDETLKKRDRTVLVVNAEEKKAVRPQRLELKVSW